MILLTAGPIAADPPGARLRAFDDWRLDCADGPCVLHTVVAGADGSEVLRVAVTGGSAPGVAVTTPIPLFLPDGLTLALGGRPVRGVPWRTCGPAGCEATLALDQELLDALRHERAGAATFTLVDGVQVRLGFSLMGFSAALRARDAVSRP